MSGPGRLKKRVSVVWSVLKETVHSFDDDDGLRQAAAFSFYGILATAPLLIVLVSVAGLVWGDSAARKEVVLQLHEVAGPQAAELASNILEGASEHATSGLSGLFSFAVFFISSSIVVVQFQKSMNAIWNVEQRENGIMGILRSRLFALGVVFFLSLLLIALVIATAFLSSLLSYFQEISVIPDWVFPLAPALLSTVLFVPIFAVLYKVVPNVRIAWSDVWFGAIVTSVLFAIGKELIAFYLTRSTTTELYGAASSLIFLLIWLYYSSIIVFFGAELTQVRARRFGDQIRPDRHSKPDEQEL
jgi:membrane protein